MDFVHVVRHKVLIEGRMQRAVARELGLARVTVRKYVDQAVPTRKLEGAPRPRPVWDAVADRVQALLAESVRWTGGKQRLTATRLHELLLTEGHRVGVTLVKEAVAEWKRQRREVFVPLTYRPGDLAAKVEDFHRAVTSHFDVGGFQIAMDDPLSCAASSASAIWRAMGNASTTGMEPCAIRSACLAPRPAPVPKRGHQPLLQDRRCRRYGDGSARPTPAPRAESERGARDRWRKTQAGL